MLVDLSVTSSLLEILTHNGGKSIQFFELFAGSDSNQLVKVFVHLKLYLHLACRSWVAPHRGFNDLVNGATIFAATHALPPTLVHGAKRTRIRGPAVLRCWHCIRHRHRRNFARPALRHKHVTIE